MDIKEKIRKIKAARLGPVDGFLTPIIHNLETKRVMNFPNSIFYLHKGIVYFEYNPHRVTLNYNYNHIFLKLEKGGAKPDIIVYAIVRLFNELLDTDISFYSIHANPNKFLKDRLNGIDDHY